MEVNFFERNVVDAGFGFTSFTKIFRGAVTNFGRELRFLQDFKNGAEGTMLLLIFGLDLEVGGGMPFFQTFSR